MFITCTLCIVRRLSGNASVICREAGVPFKNLPLLIGKISPLGKEKFTNVPFCVKRRLFVVSSFQKILLVSFRTVELIALIILF